MSVIVLFGLLSVAWTAYELGRMSRGPSRARAWDRHGRPLRIEEI